MSYKKHTICLLYTSEIQKRKALELISKGEFEKHFYFVQSKHKEIKNEDQEH